MIHFAVQQHAAGLPDKPPGPYGDHDGTDNTHGRVEPCPSKEEPAGQCGDGKYGSGRVRDDVDVRRPQIEVVVVLVVCVVMVVGVIMMVRSAEDQRANDVYPE